MYIIGFAHLSIYLSISLSFFLHLSLPLSRYMPLLYATTTQDNVMSRHKIYVVFTYDSRVHAKQHKC